MTNERLRRNAKASYLLWSTMRYGARAPLGPDGPVVLYAHELDGCPLRSMSRRITPCPQERSHNMDRGDSFEQGRGAVHGAPQGLTMEVTLHDDDLAQVETRLKDIMPDLDVAEKVMERARAKGVKLMGTPDFMVIERDTLWVLDAKDPRRPWRDSDGSYVMKASYKSRLMTYVRMARRLFLGHDGDALAKRLMDETTWPVWPGRLMTSGPIANVKASIVLSTEETYEFLILDVNDQELESHVFSSIARALTAAWLLDPSVGERVDDIDKVIEPISMVSQQEWSRQCGYCPLARKCPVAFDRGYDIIKLDPRTWSEHMSTKGFRWWETSYNGMTLKTTDEQLVKANERHVVWAWVKPKDKKGSRRVTTWSRLPSCNGAWQIVAKKERQIEW